MTANHDGRTKDDGAAAHRAEDIPLAFATIGEASHAGATADGAPAKFAPSPRTRLVRGDGTGPIAKPDVSQTRLDWAAQPLWTAATPAVKERRRGRERIARSAMWIAAAFGGVVFVTSSASYLGSHVAASGDASAPAAVSRHRAAPPDPSVAPSSSSPSADPPTLDAKPGAGIKSVETAPDIEPSYDTKPHLVGNVGAKPDLVGNVGAKPDLVGNIGAKPVVEPSYGVKPGAPRVGAKPMRR